MLTIAQDLINAWERLLQDSGRLANHDLPDFSLILSEAQQLRLSWQMDAPSYLRSFLDNGLWGRDPLWDDVARHAFTLFLCLYLLPEIGRSRPDVRCQPRAF